MLTLLWPVARVGEALETLGRRSGLRSKESRQIPVPPASLADDRRSLGKWIEETATMLGFEAESFEMTCGELEQQFRSAGPALLEMPDQGFFTLLENGFVLGPDYKVRRERPSAIRKMMCEEKEAAAADEIDSVLRAAEIRPRRQARVRRAMLRDRMASIPIGRCWRLRTPPGKSFWWQFRQARMPSSILVLAGAHLTEYALWLVSWWVIGQAALEGHLNRGWLAAWALLLGTLIAFRAIKTSLQGRIAILAGGLLKERLLYGALRLEPEEIRHRGAGQILGRIIESEAMESLALNGGFLALTSASELVFATVVLTIGAGGALSAALLVAWTVLVAILGWRYMRANENWADQRLRMTDDLVESLVGHRTRLAQEAPGQWHDREDYTLEGYATESAAMDRSLALLVAVVPRGWVIIGVLGLAPPFIGGSTTPSALAIGVGGVLLAFLAFKRLVAGLWNLVGAVTAWRQLATLTHAAARPEVLGLPDVPAVPSLSSQALIEVQDVFFRYGDRIEPVLRGCSLQLKAGDRVLLEGASGSGKSTLGSLVAGWRRPNSGLLLGRGMDRQTLGAAKWREIVAAAPQFHENYVLTASFGFNVLMGRRGILDSTDLLEAENICRELGLGRLLERMPAGLMQLVGETGWQLSHGERSRLFIARTLLQRADMVVLDESFAALDPENLRLTLSCVMKHAKTVLAITHR
jgi:ATP-binding cassette, subfamily B, bacterial